MADEEKGLSVAVDAGEETESAEETEDTESGSEEEEEESFEEYESGGDEAAAAAAAAGKADAGEPDDAGAGVQVHEQLCVCLRLSVFGTKDRTEQKMSRFSFVFVVLYELTLS